MIGTIIMEPVSKNSYFLSFVDHIYVYKKTKYQEVQIVELRDFGKSLVLDGYVQSTERDEHIYHETLVHPVMVTHPKPVDVLIIGGGEGATLREVLKHGTVSKAVNVDIDGELIELVKKYMPEFHQGAFDDRRAELVISDGKEYVRACGSASFDIVIMDLTDPYSSEIAKELYSRKFFSEIKRVLKNDGLVVTQAGNSFFYGDTYLSVLENMREVFPLVREYAMWVPSFAYANNFIIGSKRYDPAVLNEEQVDRVLESRGVKTKFFNGKVHVSLFTMPILYG